MAPIKFEEQLKDKLEKRSLQPSADAWGKLSERLDAEDKISHKPWLGWLSVAAGIIILITVLVKFFGANAVEEISPQLVEEDAIEVLDENQLPIKENTKMINVAIEDETIINETKASKAKKEPTLTNYKSAIKKSEAPKLATHYSTNALEVNEVATIIDDKTTVINDPEINKEAVAQTLNSLNAETATATDREVDSLLKLANKELLRDNLIKNSSKAVDAQSLLEDVEDEMGQSFRTKVYEALKDGYKTVKTAVAERNN